MIDQDITPENEIDTTDDSIPVPKFKRWNKYAQIVFVGLLIGAGLFGFYAVFLGIMDMSETPKILSDARIDTAYPLSVQSVFYKNNMRNEAIIYNNADWDVKTVWIGNTDDEYNAYINGRQLIGDRQFFFKGPFNSPKSFIYKIPIKVYSSRSGEDLLSSAFKNERTFLMVVDGTRVHYTISMSGTKEDTKVIVNEL